MVLNLQVLFIVRIKSISTAVALPYQYFYKITDKMTQRWNSDAIVGSFATNSDSSSAITNSIYHSSSLSMTMPPNLRIETFTLSFSSRTIRQARSTDLSLHPIRFLTQSIPRLGHPSARSYAASSKVAGAYGAESSR